MEIPSFDDIRRASEVLSGVAHHTPVLTSRLLDRLTGAHLFFKCENFQRAGAFKFRGAGSPGGLPGKKGGHYSFGG